jgi:membrane-bound serine protease (ClpP class)
VEGRRGVERLKPEQRGALADRAASIARKNGYSAAVARALIDPEVVVVEALDKDTGGVVLVDRQEVAAEPKRFTEQATLKLPGAALTIVAADAEKFGLSRHVVDDDEDLKELFGLRGRTIRVNSATWVDNLVTFLNTPWMSGFLIFLGLFMLILELKLPGIGLPAITATLAFCLFFWSRYLGGTADQLEIILFLVGLICLALELFVFPGFGVFGMSGVVLILVSVVMASHTFIWPTERYEYRQMGQTLIQLILALGGVMVGAMIVGRYLPSLPIFNRLVLRPESPEEVLATETKPIFEGEMQLGFLIGETGRTTTVLRPSGKARIGELLVDVTADGFFIERDSLIEVVDVVGSRVVVRKIG